MDEWTRDEQTRDEQTRDEGDVRRGERETMATRGKGRVAEERLAEI